MSDITLSAFYNDESKNYHSRTDILRFLLIPFMFFVLLGFPGKYGGYIATYSNFVAPAFFILFGFFTLVPEKTKRYEKIKKALRRSFKLFIIMLISYMVINVIYLAYFNSLNMILKPEFMRKRTFFNFLVLNVWPLSMGSGIWFVQSLTYAYVFFLFAERFKLDKFYYPVMIFLILFMLATGEFADFIGFSRLGYSCLPAGTVTRAIPYMLIGMFLRKNVDKLTKTPGFVYLVLFPVGLLAAVAEIEILNRIGKLVYTGHTIGFGLMALSLCCFALAKPQVKKNFLSYHGRSYSRRMYVFCQPVSLLSWVVVAVINPAYLGIVRGYSCIVSLIVSFFITFVIGLVRYAIVAEKRKKEKNIRIN